MSKGTAMIKAEKFSWGSEMGSELSCLNLLTHNHFDVMCDDEQLLPQRYTPAAKKGREYCAKHIKLETTYVNCG